MFCNTVEISEPSPLFNNLVNDMSNLMTIKDKIVCTVNISKLRRKLERKSRFLGESLTPSAKNILNMAFNEIYSSDIRRSIKSYNLLTNRVGKVTTHNDPILLSKGNEVKDQNSIHENIIDNEFILDPQGSYPNQMQIQVKSDSNPEAKIETNL